MLTSMIGAPRRDELDVNKSIVRIVEMDCTPWSALLFKMLKMSMSSTDGESNCLVCFRQSVGRGSCSKAPLLLYR